MERTELVQRVFGGFMVYEFWRLGGQMIIREFQRIKEKVEKFFILLLVI